MLGRLSGKPYDGVAYRVGRYFVLFFSLSTVVVGEDGVVVIVSRNPMVSAA